MRNGDSSARPSAVVIDSDSVLADSAAAHRAAIAAVRVKAQQLLGMAPDAFNRFFETAQQSVKKELRDAAGANSRLLHFQRMIELFGMRTQVLLTLDLEQTYWRTFLSQSKLFDGVRDFLEDLRLAEIPVAVVSDLTAQTQFRKLIYFQLDSFFDYVITAEEAGGSKSDPAAFKLALEKLQLRKGLVWVIGSSINIDNHGADGVTAIKVFHHKYSEDRAALNSGAAVERFGEFSELRTLLRRALSGDATPPSGHHQQSAAGATNRP